MEILKEIFTDFNKIFSNDIEDINFNEPMVVNLSLEFIDECS